MENFIAEDVLEAYSSGQLAKWLKVWRHKDELAQVEAIESENAREILRELVRIFDPEAEAQEIDAELSVYDYLEERRKFREYMMTHGLDELETVRRERETSKREHDKLSKERDTLRRERDTLQQENDRLKRELEASKRMEKRIDIPAGSLKFLEWTNLIPPYITCRITSTGNCAGKILLADADNEGESFSIFEACNSRKIFHGISVLPAVTSTDLSFYYDEV